MVEVEGRGAGPRAAAYAGGRGRVRPPGCLAGADGGLRRSRHRAFVLRTRTAGFRLAWRARVRAMCCCAAPSTASADDPAARTTIVRGLRCRQGRQSAHGAAARAARSRCGADAGYRGCVAGRGGAPGRCGAPHAGRRPTWTRCAASRASRPPPISPYSTVSSVPSGEAFRFRGALAPAAARPDQRAALVSLCHAGTRLPFRAGGARA